MNTQQNGEATWNDVTNLLTNEVLTEYHWGKWVSSNTPVTGVVSCRSLEWIHDETHYHAVTNLSYDDYMEQNIAERLAEWQDQHSMLDVPMDEDLLEEWRDQLGEQYEESGDTYLIGDWRLDSTGQFQIDYGGTNHFAAIVDYNFAGGIVQVVWSHYVTSAALCSPCCPGQCDLDTPGDFLGYDLPLDFYGQLRQTTETQRVYSSESDFLVNLAYA